MAEIDPSNVVYIAPETKQREAREEAVRELSGDPDKLLERLNEIDATVTGEYREYLGDEIIEGVRQPKLGPPLVFWHDDDDPATTSGKYVAFDSKKHGGNYRAAPRRNFVPIVEER